MTSHGSGSNVPGGLKFGLNISSKKTASAGPNPLSAPRPSATSRPPPKAVFADDDDDELTGDAAERAKVNASIKQAQAHSRKVAELEYEKALAEDPNAFDYDGVYDDMKKVEERRKKGAEVEEDKAKKVRDSVGSVFQIGLLNWFVVV
jgi:coiled-coil domain-containing protein 55